MHRGSVYATVEAPQEKGTSGEGEAEVSRTRAQDHWNRSNPHHELVKSVNHAVTDETASARTETVIENGSGIRSCLSGHDCGLLRRNFALDKVGGLLGLRRGGNQQPRIRLAPCNPRGEIAGLVFKSVWFDSR